MTSVVYVMVGSVVEARRIARVLVEERLAACGNVVSGVNSIYRWEGAVQEDDETLLILKVANDRLQAVVERVRDLHSYECPCITSWPIERGHTEYLEWIVLQSTET